MPGTSCAGIKAKLENKAGLLLRSPRHSQREKARVVRLVKNKIKFLLPISNMSVLLLLFRLIQLLEKRIFRF